MIIYVIAKEQSDCGNPEDWCTNACASRATLAMTMFYCRRKEFELFGYESEFVVYLIARSQKIFYSVFNYLQICAGFAAVKMSVNYFIYSVLLEKIGKKRIIATGVERRIMHRADNFVAVFPYLIYF